MLKARITQQHSINADLSRIEPLEVAGISLGYTSNKLLAIEPSMHAHTLCKTLIFNSFLMLKSMRLNMLMLL